MRPVFDPVWNLSRGGIRDFQCASGCGPASPHVFMASECMLESRIRRLARTGMLSQARPCESPEEQPRGPEKPPRQGERFTSCDQRHLPVKPSARRGAFRRSAGGPPAGRGPLAFFAAHGPLACQPFGRFDKRSPDFGFGRARRRGLAGLRRRPHCCRSAGPSAGGER
jgi:hypothetical protein